MAWVLWLVMVVGGEEVRRAADAVADRTAVARLIEGLAAERGWEVAPSGLSAWSADGSAGAEARPSSTSPLDPDDTTFTI